VRAPRFAQLSSDSQGRIQSCQRTLQYDTDLFPAYRTQLPFRFLKQLFPLKNHLASCCGSFEIQQPQNTHSQSALAASAFSDKPEYFTRVEVQR
jgi:hypothetical protein